MLAITQHNNHRVCAIPLFQDNYAWLIYDQTHAWIIDPGQAQPIAAATTQLGVSLKAFFITHSHWDHVGGIDELAAMQPQAPTVFGPPHIHSGINHSLQEGDTIDLNGLTLEVWHTPGHMAEHLSFYCREAHWLFCGDTVFAGGCGRLKQTGNMRALFNSINRIKALPPQTKLFCAHEYTQANSRFAQAVEPNNKAIAAFAQTVNQKRQNQQITVPTTIADELACNPFFRAHLPSVAAGVAASVAASNNMPLANDPFAVFAALRQWKDRF